MELNEIIEAIIKAIGFHTAGLTEADYGQVATAVKSHLEKVVEGFAVARTEIAEQTSEGPASDQAQGE